MQHTHIAGQTLHLLPERAAFWAERRLLLVADAEQVSGRRGPWNGDFEVD